MRRLVPCYAVLVGLVFGACGVQVFVKPPPEPIRSEQTELWEREVLKVAQSGDWIVLRGYHDTDHLVAASTNMPVSHAVILDMDTRTIIEAVGSGIAEMRLRKRLHEAHRVLLIRPKWWTPKRGKQAVERARTQLGGAYDFLGTVGAPSSDRFYCTELALYGYATHIAPTEHFPKIVEPAHMLFYGTTLFDSGPRN